MNNQKHFIRQTKLSTFLYRPLFFLSILLYPGDQPWSVRVTALSQNLAFISLSRSSCVYINKKLEKVCAN